MSKTNIFMVPTERTVHVPYEKTVIEKKAPTDESIKLYEEIKEKAYSSILDTIEVKDNSLNLTAVLYKDNFSWKTVCKYKVVLNGNVFSGEVAIEDNVVATRPMAKVEVYKQIVGDVAKKLAVDLVRMAVSR